MTDAELVQFMVDELRRDGQSCGEVMDAAAARCAGDSDRAWRLIEPTCEQILRGLPDDDGPPNDQPYVVRWRHRVKRSALKAAPRWVLVALSQYANKHGDGRWPSTDTLARDTGYTRRAVEKHLRTAMRDGWLARRTRGLSGRGWRQQSYQLVIPPDVGNGVPQVEPYSREVRWERASRRAEKAGNTVPNVRAEDGNEIPNVPDEVGNGVQEGREPRSHDLLVNGNQQKKLPSGDDVSLHASVGEHTHEGASAAATVTATAAEMSQPIAPAVAGPVSPAGETPSAEASRNQYLSDGDNQSTVNGRPDQYQIPVGDDVESAALESLHVPSIPTEAETEEEIWEP